MSSPGFSCGQILLPPSPSTPCMRTRPGIQAEPCGIRPSPSRASATDCGGLQSDSRPRGLRRPLRGPRPPDQPLGMAGLELVVDTGRSFPIVDQVRQSGLGQASRPVRVLHMPPQNISKLTIFKKIVRKNVDIYKVYLYNLQKFQLQI